MRTRKRMIGGNFPYQVAIRVPAGGLLALAADMYVLPCTSAAYRISGLPDEAGRLAACGMVLCKSNACTGFSSALRR